MSEDFETGNPAAPLDDGAFCFIRRGLCLFVFVWVCALIAQLISGCAGPDGATVPPLTPIRYAPASVSGNQPPSAVQGTSTAVVRESARAGARPTPLS